MGLDYYFDLSSSYSYVGTMRIEGLCQAAGVRMQWKPFLLGAVFKGIANYSPMVNVPTRVDYAWRDIQRLCGKYGLACDRPRVFPQRSVLANRAIIAVIDQPWVGDFIRGLFRAQFAEQKDIGNPGTVELVLGSLGIDGAQVLKDAETEPVKLKLREFTDQAIKLGIFGAPNAVVGDELFFGQDRLEDAVAYARDGKLPGLD